jgi:GMP synthase (glutamine-hydrolysing)
VKPILAIENEDIAGLGSAEEVFRAEDLPVEVVRLWKGDDLPPLDEGAALVPLGGDMNVDQVDAYPYLAAEREYLTEAVSRDVPILGICLGGQLLARALGGAVRRAETPELGFLPIDLTAEGGRDPVLSALVDGGRVFQWHVDSFDLPAGTTLLATGRRVRNQAFRAGRRAWGVQFHPEVTADELDLWFDTVGGLERTYGRTEDEVRTEIQEHLPSMRRRAAELFRRFAAIVRGP